MAAQEEQPQHRLLAGQLILMLGDALGGVRLNQGLWSSGGVCPGVLLAEHPAAELTLPYSPGLMRVLPHTHTHACAHVPMTQNSVQIDPLHTDTMTLRPPPLLAHMRG